MTEDEFLNKLQTLAAERRAESFICENCGWFADAKNGTGECHRNPPATTTALSDSPWLFPIVHADNVCGEFVHRKTAKRFVPDPVEPLRVRVAAIEERLDRRGFTLIEAIVALAILATLVGLLWPAISGITRVATGGNKENANEPPRTVMLDTVQHDGHWWVTHVTYRTAAIVHHPDCPCVTRTQEVEK